MRDPGRSGRFACRRAIVVAAQRPMHASDIKLTNDLETVLAGGGVCVCARCRGRCCRVITTFALIYGPWFLFPMANYVSSKYKKVVVGINAVMVGR